jgi:hypothetical protein
MIEVPRGSIEHIIHNYVDNVNFHCAQTFTITPNQHNFPSDAQKSVQSFQKWLLISHQDGCPTLVAFLSFHPSDKDPSLGARFAARVGEHEPSLGSVFNSPPLMEPEFKSVFALPPIPR